MLEYGDIGIKGPDDLAEAIKSGMAERDFVSLFKSMVERWGVESTLSMWGDALFDKDYGVLKSNPNITASSIISEQARQLGLARHALKKVTIVSDIDIAKIIVKDALKEMSNKEDL